MMLDAYPRSLGFPRQSIVYDQDRALELIDRNNGIAPCFSSHNSYPIVSKNGNPKTVLYEWCPFDLDSDNLEETLVDARKLVSFANAHSLPYLVRFSGGHGFHVYFRFSPFHIKLDPASSRVVSSLQNYVISKLDLQTADPHIIGDLRRLLRLPGTKWAKEKKSQVTLNGKWCLTLTESELFDLSAHQIRELCSTFRWTPEEATPADPTLRFTDFIRKLDYDVDEHARKSAPAGANAFMAYNEVNEELLSELMQKPCAVSALCGPKPNHVIRMYLVTRLNRLGFPKSWIEGLLYDLAERYAWETFDVGTSSYQIDNLIEGGYKHPSCATIKARGGCMGPSCSNYRECA